MNPWLRPRLEGDEPGTGHHTLLRLLFDRLVARGLGERGPGPGDREAGTGEHAAVLGEGEEPGALVEGVAGASLRLVTAAPGAVERDDAGDEAARGGEHPPRLAEERGRVVGEAERDDEDHASKGAVTERQLLAGVEAVATGPGLANPKGFVPVDDHYRHQAADGVYAVGVAVALPPAGETPVPVNFPKTGHMTEQMADIAARDLAARIDGREGETAELSARCVLDMGDRGAYMAVDPVRPPRNRIPTVSEGRRWLYAKQAFERAYLATARRGRRMPTTLGW